MQVVDQSGKPVEIGQPGELVARGANVMRGYWNNQKETALPFLDSMFRTRDIGYQDAAGYFLILDRLKDMIVTGDENVYSGEVEESSTSIRGFAKLRCLECQNSHCGEIVVACVVLSRTKVLALMN